ncbi:MAG: AarF/ABC1/UbiB kinase family protein [Alphaproteobacteria bacterium]|nr:AarF/ABC1/UbiB kinase family protein [Alphaproteobacteria bacterium]
MSNQDKENTLTGRLARYGKVSSAVVGLTARVAGERYLGLPIERNLHAEQLGKVLGNLKGPIMKIGQILATIPEALPPEYAQAFQQLQSNAPPMSWPFVRRRMKGELGPDWERKFASFEKEAAAAASLGQVHKARAHDGRVLACKLQYPDMESALQADLNQLQMLFSLYERYDGSFQMQGIQEELAARLREELDYDREARHTKLYGSLLREERTVHVPEVLDDLSTGRLLTMSWLEGTPILNPKDADQSVRNEIALNMFRAWYVPLYFAGIIHGDPHPGNYTVRSDFSINLLDFGCVRVFPPSFIGGVIDLYKAMMTRDFNLAVHAYETWGFQNLSRDQVETLNIWANFLYAPLLEDRVRPIGEITKGVYGRETAEKVHRKLKESGTIRIPREFVFMDRAALGLGSVFLRLRAEINWHRVFNELIEGFDERILAEKQKKALADFGL